MSNYVRSGKTFQRSSLRHNGIAGSGVEYDDYSENSGNQKHYQDKVIVKMPHDNVDPEMLNGECIVVKEGRKNGTENV